LAPSQLGFGIAGEAEAAVRAVRRYIDNMMPRYVFVKINFKNAFNTLKRDSILEAVAKYFPELLAFAQSTIGQASVLQFGDFVLRLPKVHNKVTLSGRYIFAWLSKNCWSLDNKNSSLDDKALGGNAACVMNDFIQLKAAAKQL